PFLRKPAGFDFLNSLLILRTPTSFGFLNSPIEHLRKPGGFGYQILTTPPGFGFFLKSPLILRAPTGFGFLKSREPFILRSLLGPGLCSLALLRDLPLCP